MYLNSICFIASAEEAIIHTSNILTYFCSKKSYYKILIYLNIYIYINLIIFAAAARSIIIEKYIYLLLQQEGLIIYNLEPTSSRMILFNWKIYSY